MAKLPIDFLRWYTGKALQRATEALELVERSIEEGGWLPGASRKCRAAFNKANEAQKLIKRNVWIELLRAPGEDEYGGTGDAFYYAMTYGSWEKLVEVGDYDKLTYGNGGKRLTLDEQQVVAELVAFRNEVLPIWEAMEVLDRSRPKPVFTILGVSPTITGTMQDLGAVKIEVCEIEFKRVTYTTKEGKKSWRWVGKLLWPAGTMHGNSRYGTSQAGNRQCESCGHAIKNPFNWVPLIVWHRDGTPQSLWTGRDCAERIFGIKMTGELELEDDHVDKA